MHKMPILHIGIAGYSLVAGSNCYIIVGRILLFVWDAHIHVGIVYTHSYNRQYIAVCIGCLFSQRDAHIY